MKRESVLLVMLFSFLAFDYPQERTISGKITSRRMAEGAKGDDKQGYRSEFLNLVKSYSLMARH